MAVVLGLSVAGLVATSCSNTSPAEESNNLVAQCLGAEGLGQTSQAISYCKQAVAKNPNNKAAHYDLGVLYQQLGDSTDAVSEYKQTLVIDPKYKPALWNLAIIQSVPNPTEAITIYNELLNLNPNDPNVNFNLGLLLISQGGAQALQGHVLLKKAIQLNPALAQRVPQGITP